MRSITFALATLLTTSAAHAYQLKRDSTGEVVRWSGGAAHFVVDTKLAELLQEPRAFNAIHSAVEALSHAAVGLTVTVAAGETSGVGYDAAPGAQNQNEVVALEEWIYAPGAVAVTVLTLDAKRHHILDADIAFNAQHRRFKVLPDHGEPGGDFHDVQNTLTHELGHAVGLAHNPEREDAVMYPSASRGEIQKRLVSDDDQQGLAELYPSADAMGGLDNPYAGVGCSATGSAPRAWWVLALALLLVGRRWRAGRGAVAAFALCASPAQASEPLERASLVATADVVSARTVPPAANARLLYTELELRVRECIRGQCGGTIRIKVPGGRFGEIEQVVEDHPVPGPGEVVAIIRADSATLLRMAEPAELVHFARALADAGMRADLTFAVKRGP